MTEPVRAPLMVPKHLVDRIMAEGIDAVVRSEGLKRARSPISIPRCIGTCSSDGEDHVTCFKGFDGTETIHV